MVFQRRFCNYHVQATRFRIRHNKDSKEDKQATKETKYRSTTDQVPLKFKK